ncbi:MAG: ATP-binding protein [Mailhella sp.]|nr:ATP-binding protein [Mailhella sp.]
MGTYFNPDNTSFRKDISGRIYVDKTGLLSLTNSFLGTADCCVALSHARRFGKSQAAGMIDAYYSSGCDSRELFSKFEIANSPDFESYLNKYNVIHLDISSVADSHKEDLVENIMERLLRDLRSEHEDCCISGDIERILDAVYHKTGAPFVIIIDEWDCVVRNHSDRPDLVHRYMQFLHSIFKSEESKSFLALGYITGILPIKKIHDESALNNFREYTMLDSDALTPYFGFTESEVRELCVRFGKDFESIRQWYDGYRISGLDTYNPNSVSQAMTRMTLQAFWKNTSAFDTINKLITLDFTGLKDDVLTMLKGGKVRVRTHTFGNDLTSIKSKDDALTALIHLGYLGYDADRGTAYIPNYEVSTAFQAALETGCWKEIAASISRCEDILWATIDGNAEQVAELLELAHRTYASQIKSNDENSLSCAVPMAYFTAPAYYSVVREMPAGTGFADFALIPRREAGDMPAMVIELKWNHSAETAIDQIKDRRYAGALAGYAKEVLLVGISYDRDSKDKKHSCIIEKLDAGALLP